MTTRALAIVSILAVAVFGDAACSSKGGCTADNCTGCCVDANTCVDGTSKAQCGGNGDACQACSGICFMHKCSGGGGGDGGTDGGTDGGSDGGYDAGVLDAGILLPCPQSCAGCCGANGLCFIGTDTANCGTGGLACSSCSGSQSCTNNVCTDPNCTGCVSGSVCRTAADNGHCGAGGRACIDCTASGATCNTGAGTCTGAQCPNGCVDSLGRCQSGENKGYCGTGGAACVACTEGQGCSDGGCISTRPLALPGDNCPALDGLYPGMPTHGQTTFYNNDFVGSCGGSSGPDHVYVLYVLAPPLNNVDITVAPDNSTFQPVIYARASCADTVELTHPLPDGGASGQCAAASGGGSSATIHFDQLNNSIAVYVDGVNGSSGSYVITANYSP